METTTSLRAGSDTVATGTGDDTVAFLDVCELDKPRRSNLGTRQQHDHFPGSPAASASTRGQHRQRAKRHRAGQFLQVGLLDQA